MRNAFADEITRLADVMPELTLLSGDIGNRLFNTFKERHPTRFLNCGVAEANMTGVAAGMALAGLRPITYTIASFNTGRCLEQIRLDLCYHNLPVVVTGVGAGLSYAALGPTHHSLEDIAWLRSLPNMTVLCPADAIETRLALRAALQHHGPVYLRLGKKNEPVIHETQPDFRIGKGIILREGVDACLLSVGTITSVALEAADILIAAGISTRVVSMHTVKPLDTELLHDVFSRFSTVGVIEEHGPGGAWSAVAEWRAESGASGRILRFGTPDSFLHEAGGQAWVRGRLGLTASAIVQRVRAALSGNET